MGFKSKLSVLRAAAGRSGARAKKEKQLASASARVSLGKSALRSVNSPTRSHRPLRPLSTL